MLRFRLSLWLAFVIPVLLVLLVYLPNLGTTFTGMDVPAYSRVLSSNDMIEMAGRLLSDVQGKLVVGYYAPLGSISLMLDKWFAGSQVPVPRITSLLNVIFHCINGVLLGLLLKRLSTGPLVIGVMLCVFLLHPVQVSTVLWFAERKTLVATLFLLLAYLSYIGWRRSGRLALFPLVLGCFVLGLLSKPTVIVFPALLLVTEITLIRKEESILGDKAIGTHHRAALFGVPWVGLLNIALLSVIAFAWALLVIRTESSFNLDLSLLHRPLIAASVFWFYVLQIVAPLNLMYMYPRWEVQASEWLWWIPLFFLLVSAYGLVRFRKKIPAELWWGLGHFALPLVPVLGFVGFWYLRFSFVADHFLYLSMIGASYCIGVLFAKGFNAVGTSFRRVMAASAVAVLVLLVMQTFNHARLWKHEETLWKHTLDHCSSCWVAENAYGMALVKRKDHDRGLVHLRRAVEINPNYAKGYNDLAVALLATGNTVKSKQYLEKALSLKPIYADAENNLGLVYKQTGDLSKAALHYRKAILADPYLAGARINFGRLLEQTGRLNQAMTQYKTAVRLAPHSSQAHFNMGNAMVKMGMYREALGQFKKALELDPSHFPSLFNLGSMYLNMSRFSDAITMFRKALAVQPDSTRAQEALDMAVQLQRRLSPAR